tara:strand:+ start:432 stop:884 length:453 start_codon:yes stop_codon:yes gene_type:complete
MIIVEKERVFRPEFRGIAKHDVYIGDRIFDMILASKRVEYFKERGKFEREYSFRKGMYKFDLGSGIYYLSFERSYSDRDNEDGSKEGENLDLHILSKFGKKVLATFYFSRWAAPPKGDAKEWDDFPVDEGISETCLFENDPLAWEIYDKF